MGTKRNGCKMYGQVKERFFNESFDWPMADSGHRFDASLSLTSKDVTTKRI